MECVGLRTQPPWKANSESAGTPYLFPDSSLA